MDRVIIAIYDRADASHIFLSLQPSLFRSHLLGSNDKAIPSVGLSDKEGE